MATATREAAPARKSISERIWYKAIASLMTAALLVACAGFGGMAILCYGPSPSARNSFIATVAETKGLGFLPRFYFSAARAKEILSGTRIEKLEETSDAGLIRMPTAYPLQDEGGIVLEKIEGTLYTATMLLVRDPSRLALGLAGGAPEGRASTVADIVALYDGVGGVNARAEGVEAVGENLQASLVVSGGLLLGGATSGQYGLVGFDGDNKLIVGYMSGLEALDRGMRDGISGALPLIVNGVSAETKGGGSGINARTAIGQKADGTVLLLTIDGWQYGSYGGTWQDVIDIMAFYGAVHAASLDGGMYASMDYQGGRVGGGGLWGRGKPVANAFVVKTY